MAEALTAKKVLAFINKKDLSPEDRSLLITALLKRFAAIPLHDIIYVSENGQLFVNGRKASSDTDQSLRISAERSLGEPALKFVREQVAYLTFVNAGHKASNLDELIFYRAALWWGQQEDKYLKLLAKERHDGNSSQLPGDF